MASFEPTPAVQRALHVARQFAWRLRSDHLEPSHLLQGLLHEDQARPWQLLVEAGIEPNLLRQVLPTGENAPSDSEPPIGGAVRHIMSRARELARGYGEEYSISSEHLLLALLESDKDLRQELEMQGLEFSLIESVVCRNEGPPLKLDEPLRLEQTVDLLTAARIIDATANRSREALRVLEDYCRFALDDAYLTSELKRLRHGLTSAMNLLPADALLGARDAAGDVGATITVAGEMDRGQLRDVLQAGCKRLQEALRSLEEYGKLFSVEFAREIEALRYRAYSLEPALSAGTGTRGRLDTIELCVLLTSAQCRMSAVGTARDAVEGGARMIQLREKNIDDRSLLTLARDVCNVVQKAGAVFILNDRPDLARLVGADGVHLGQNDMPVPDARRFLGPNAIIGVSTHDSEQVHQAVIDGANYIGVGPVFASTTKQFDSLLGLEFVRQVSAETSLPIFAIGGITAENVAQVRAAGARRVAVSAAVCQAKNPSEAASAIIRELRRS